jgi:hypothetical protein
MRKIIAAAAAAIALAAPVASVTAASAAPAQRTPVMYSGMGGAWQNAARRPHGFTLGADFGVNRMSWSRWTNTSAYGHGHLLACAGAAGPCVSFRAGVTLTIVRRHHGTRYFAVMKLTGRGHRTQRLVMRDGGWILTTRGYDAA